MTNLSLAQYEIASLDLDSDVSLWFDNQIGKDQTQLVAGIYQPTYVSTNSHPFYLEKSWIKGTIKYRGQVFQEVGMIYNIHEDLLIIQHPVNLTLASQPIKLEKKQVEWFVLKQYHFKNLTELNNKSGFYNMLYEGSRVTLISKRNKKEEIERSNEPVGYKIDHKYYLIKGNDLILVKGKSGFTKAYPSLKKDIKNFVKENRIIVNVKNENAMISLTQFCDSKLNNQ